MISFCFFSIFIFSLLNKKKIEKKIKYHNVYYCLSLSNIKMDNLCQLCIKDNVVKQWYDEHKYKICDFDLRLFQDDSNYQKISS